MNLYSSFHCDDMDPFEIRILTFTVHDTKWGTTPYLYLVLQRHRKNIIASSHGQAERVRIRQAEIPERH